jgi:hypothetical protein
VQSKLLEVESRLFNRNIIQLGSETYAEEYAQNEQKLMRIKTHTIYNTNWIPAI